MKLTTYSRLTRIKQENMIYIYDFTIIDVTGCNNFQLFNLGEISRNYYTPVAYYQVISVIIYLNVQVKGK